MLVFWSQNDAKHPPQLVGNAGYDAARRSPLGSSRGDGRRAGRGPHFHRRSYVRACAAAHRQDFGSLRASTAPSAANHPAICATAGMVSLTRIAMAAFKWKLCVVPVSSVKRSTIPSDIPCTAAPVTRVAVANSSSVAAPGLVLPMAASQRWNCDLVKLPGISFSMGCCGDCHGEAQAGVLQSRPATRPQPATVAALHSAPVGGAGNLPPLYDIPFDGVI